MDRHGTATAAAPLDVDQPDESGWDAYAIWQSRVHGPRLGASTAKPGRKFTVEEPAQGWDPLQTWQLRVRRARDAKR